MFDVTLQGGAIYDGNGGEPYGADIAVKNGQIVAIGQLANFETAELLDINGLAVCPGFIDIHTHSDFTLLVNGKADSQVHQGVTTEVVGQCGTSCAPARCDRDIEVMAPGFKHGFASLGWRSFGDYLDALEKQSLGVNVAAFVGHGTVHRAVLGNVNTPPNPDEVEAMAHMVEEAVDHGAMGFSTGLEYWPGSVSAPEHIAPLVEVVAKRDLLYATHVRNRDIYYDLGFGEALTTARSAGAKLQISHIQPKFGAPEYAMQHSIEMIETGRRYGIDVAFDVIPHEWSHTSVLAILPQWAQEGGIAAVLERLARPELRESLKVNPKPIWRIVAAGRWGDIVLMQSEANSDLVGLTFSEIGRQRGKPPFDVALDLLLEEGENINRLLWTSRSFRQSDIELCLNHPQCAVMSDTWALSSQGPLADHIGSLSGYGWAARFLRTYVRERKILSFSEAIRRITSLPADRLGLSGRGRLAKGSSADITVLDPATITDHDTVEQPRRYASGIAHVMVNGKLSMRNGKRTHINNGSVLRHR
ncbi:MAG: amidohydrolase family protein [Roseitalea sp.]|nr:amidohydrolase family protein [Roseitalea sp.]MBO6721821.1 amidohydrolase family protein [Roseitalea sp.]MBO6744865.1 amidohydrolase family protein [Roseitalea sp.]